MPPLARLLDSAVVRPGSTRAVGLLRVALALILWARFGEVFQLWAHAGFFMPLYVAMVASFNLSTVLMLIGYRARAATAWAGIGGLASILIAGLAFGDRGVLHHHTYLIVWSTILLSLTPCGASFSLDRWLAVRAARRSGAPAPEERGDLWATRLIALQVSFIYFFGGWDKVTTPGFATGEAIELLLVQAYTSSAFQESAVLPLLGRVFGPATIALEFALAFGLWVPRLRSWLVPLGLLFHGGLYMAAPVATFSVTMWALYLVVVSPDAVHRVVDDLVGPRIVDPRA